MEEDLIPFLSEGVVKRIPPEKRVRGLTEEDLRSLDRETQDIVKRLMNNLSEKQNQTFAAKDDSSGWRPCEQ